ncbi:MAG: histidinol-phosphate transaminase [Clostridia bacterium]|nr:histidinol-phosphate transaminase [Clostridia bacterium]MBO7155900.1 histidinol-phosphate transaminase [Clostridia bacterium]
MSKFLVEKFNTLTPYVPGEQPKEKKYVKLNTNESPFPPSPKAVEYACREAQKVMLYSDPDVTDLVQALAKTYGVQKENVIVTNGSDEVLNFAFMAYCNEQNPAIFADITYGFYKVFAEVNALPYKQIPLKDDFRLDINDYVNECGTIFIANPNAPTGIALSLDEIETLVKANENRIVVIDEAYVDFGTESAVALTKKYDNVLVTQTFSKSRSMAGARVGFGIGSQAIIDDLNRIRYSTNPYNVNRMSEYAGVGALEDKEYFENNCRTIIANREWTVNELKKLGFTMTDSKANFIFAKSDSIDGKELYLKLKERGVLVRHFDKARIRDYNRITIGSFAEMQTYIDTVKTILEK